MLGTRHIWLKAGELIVGTADRWQEDVDKPSLPPYTAFLVQGPIEYDVRVWYAGWDYWANVYDEENKKFLLEQKVNEIKQKSDYPQRGLKIIKLP
jgi:hypothetical protein